MTAHPMTAHAMTQNPTTPGQTAAALLAVLLCGWFTAPVLTAQAAAKPLSPQAVPAIATTIGMRVRIEELPLPGSQLRAKPVQDPQKAPLILRVLNVFPHGSGFRYNFEITPLIAGRLDLREHLEREDGGKTDDLPEIPVLVKAELPPERFEPNALRASRPDPVGGYRSWQIVAAVLWVFGLLAILLVRRRRPTDAAAQQAAVPLTLADRLRPLVEGARSGSLDDARRAELERLLLAYWRQRTNLQDEKIGAAIATLRRDPEASPLILKLEEWLHQPQALRAPDAAVHEEIAALLEPYQNAPDLGDERSAAEKESA